MKSPIIICHQLILANAYYSDSKKNIPIDNYNKKSLNYLLLHDNIFEYEKQYYNC